MDKTAGLEGMMSGLDAIAVAYFFAAVLLYRLAAGSRVLHPRSLPAAVQRQRLSWMLNMGKRDNRMLDAILLGSLGQGNAFFASTSAIAVGGVAAGLASGGERLQSLLDGLPYAAPASPSLWAAKLMLIMSIFIYAFFKFAWAFRLSHYASMMIGATPNADAADTAAAEDHARRAAGVIGLAGEHSNAGLRSFYHAIAAISWFWHPVLFILATTWVILILIRRDFFSRSLRLIAEGP